MTVIGFDTNLHKTAVMDVVGEVSLTPNGQNVAIRVGRPSEDARDGWQQVGYVLLSHAEVDALITRLQEVRS
jgi:hypothetical protein